MSWLAHSMICPYHVALCWFCWKIVRQKMEPKRFAVGEQFYWNDILYRIRDIDKDGNVEIVDRAGKVQSVHWRELAKALFDTKLERAISGKHARPGQNGKLSTARQYPDYTNAPEDLHKEAELREKFLLPLVDLKPRERSDEYI